MRVIKTRVEATLSECVRSNRENWQQ